MPETHGRFVAHRLGAEESPSSGDRHLRDSSVVHKVFEGNSNRFKRVALKPTISLVLLAAADRGLRLALGNAVEPVLSRVH
ncbi:hypothetical protein MUK42_37190 [Musa troglodytarum]|uniref:Uncharacterized protein n=1 Tax=Musa troglodytarum TaxID=320322 RepID=A0A9E7FAC2_9LILI|nr:hypothetical protein MUK42_37190 [Musa troglodytarum]URD92320.1 hypothetical protein MUK42_37190 [Musa troglodytarum]URD92321.1 hypothetical protein MUK42_37190 [Musa troglodytarum]